MRSFIAVLLTVASLAPVRADDGIPQSPPERFDTSFSAGDWTLAWLFGNALGLVGGAAGAGVGYAFAGDCDEDCGLFHGLGEAAIGATIGFTFANAAGIYGYGELSGHSGNYWATAGGVVVGMLGTAAISSLSEDRVLPTISLFVLPALAGTAAYVLTLESGAGDDWQPTGGLIDIDRGQVRLAMPAVNIGLDDDGHLSRVDVDLLGARF